MLSCGLRRGLWELLWGCGWSHCEPNTSGGPSLPRLWKILFWGAGGILKCWSQSHLLWGIHTVISNLKSSKSNSWSPLLSSGSLGVSQISVNGTPCFILLWAKKPGSHLWVLSNTHTPLPIISTSHWLCLQTVSEIRTLPPIQAITVSHLGHCEWTPNWCPYFCPWCPTEATACHSVWNCLLTPHLTQSEKQTQHIGLKTLIHLSPTTFSDFICQSPSLPLPCPQRPSCYSSNRMHRPKISDYSLFRPYSVILIFLETVGPRTWRPIYIFILILILLKDRAQTLFL